VTHSRENPSGGTGLGAVDPGQVLLASGLAGLGLVSLVSGDFSFVWQTFQETVERREVLARLSGAFLLVFGLGMLARRTAAGSALLMTAYLLSWVLIQQAPRVAHAPADIGVLLGAAESVMMVCGCWMIHTSIAQRECAEDPGLAGTRRFSPWGIRTAQALIGISCLILGLSHFKYTQITANMVPGWLPGHIFFAYLTGAGHFAAGLGILLAVAPRLAATLEAGMIGCFALLVQLPGVISAPASGQQWMKLLVTTALSGSVWAVAYSLRGTRWSFAGHREIEVNP